MKLHFQRFVDQTNIDIQVPKRHAAFLFAGLPARSGTGSISCLFDCAVAQKGGNSSLLLAGELGTVSPHRPLPVAGVFRPERSNSSDERAMPGLFPFRQGTSSVTWPYRGR
jgi:hypothetical protein